MRSVLQLVIVLVLLSGCATPPPKQTAKAPDNWQKSKECAEQSDKLMSQWRSLAGTWENHYSPKYNRCFVLSFREVPREGQSGTLFEKSLFDAFQRSEIAVTLQPIPPKTMEFLCHTRDDEHASCEATRIFIEEHMKN